MNVESFGLGVIIKRMKEELKKKKRMEIEEERKLRSEVNECVNKEMLIESNRIWENRERIWRKVLRRIEEELFLEERIWRYKRDENVK